MTAYFDTSSMMKIYVKEAGWELARATWNAATRITCSRLLWPEMWATFARKRREGTPAPIVDVAEVKFSQDWDLIDRIDLTEAVLVTTRTLVRRHVLRGADAVHPARALMLRRTTREQVTFVCADTRLIDAASAEGLLVARTL